MGTNADLAQLRKRTAPTWWRDAKLGIFVHWTPASVPAFAPTDRDLGQILADPAEDAMKEVPYVEWYQNSLRFPDSSVARHHREHHGDPSTYYDFGARFDAGLAHWDPEAWARRFAQAGARYVVLVTKHHDGYCLWPSSVPNPHRSGWHTTRDVVGDLAAAVRAEGLRFGIYYSGGLDWTFDDTPIGTMAAGAAAMPGGDYGAYAEAQVREIIERYRPSVLWNDIAWPQPAERLWKLFRHYFDVVPDGVVNDRWLPRSAAFQLLKVKPLRRQLDKAISKAAAKGEGMLPPSVKFCDYRTPEYTAFAEPQPWRWECVRGMDLSFGHNAYADETHFLSRDDLVSSVIDITAAGGNLLLNVGPTGDAQIPPAQWERLGWLGEVMAGDNGLHDTDLWPRSQGTTAEGLAVRYTARGRHVHAFVADHEAGPVTLTDLRATPTTAVAMVPAEATEARWEPVPWSVTDAGAVRIDAPTASLDRWVRLRCTDVTG